MCEIMRQINHISSHFFTQDLSEMFSQYTAQEFKDMVTRCKKVNVDIYVDAVINHVGGGSGKLQFPWCWVDGS